MSCHLLKNCFFLQPKQNEKGKENCFLTFLNCANMPFFRSKVLFIVVSAQVSTPNHLQNIKRIAQEFTKKGFVFNIHKNESVTSNLIQEKYGK